MPNAKKDEVKKHKVYSAARAAGLDNAIRRLIHNPHKILKQYIKEGMTVLDIGCGPGVFSIESANLVGKRGKVVAADLQEGMLAIVKSKLDETTRKIIRLHKTNEDRMGIVEKADFILAFYMLHEVKDQVNFLDELKSILKPHGKILVIEPKFHVSKKEFEESIEKAKFSGFDVALGPKVLFSRSILLSHSEDDSADDYGMKLK